MAKCKDRIDLFSSLNIQKDRGFAWLVCASSVASHMLGIGFSFAIAGTLTLIQQKHFNITESGASWIIGLHVCLLFVCGPPVTWLIKHLTVRKMQIAGGVLSTTGMALSYFSTEAWHAYLLYSVITGMGFCCCYIASSEILQVHFERHIYLASALVMFGYNSGFLIFASLSQLLFDNYGYNTSMLIMSGSQLLHIIGGLTYVCPETQTNAITKNQEPSQISDNTPNSDHKEPSNQEGHDNSAIQMEVEEMHLGEIKSSEVEEVSTENSSQHPAEHLGYFEQIKKLIRNPRAVSFVICGFLWNFSNTAFYTLVNNYIIQKTGISEADAALGVTIGGAFSIASVIPISLTSQLQYDRLIIHSAGAMLLGGTYILIVFATGKVYYLIGMAFFGFVIGVQLSNLLGVAYGICGADQMVVLFGVELAFEGVGGLIGPPICSHMAEAYGLKSGLLLAGILNIIAGFILVPVIVIRLVMRSTKSMTVEITTDKENGTLADVCEEG